MYKFLNVNIAQGKPNDMFILAVVPNEQYKSDNKFEVIKSRI